MGAVYEAVLGEGEIGNSIQRIPDFSDGCCSEVSEMRALMLSTHRRELLLPGPYPKPVSPWHAPLRRPLSKRRRMRVALLQLGS